MAFNASRSERDLSVTWFLGQAPSSPCNDCNDYNKCNCWNNPQTVPPKRPTLPGSREPPGSLIHVSGLSLTHCSNYSIRRLVVGCVHLGVTNRTIPSYIQLPILAKWAWERVRGNGSRNWRVLPEELEPSFCTTMTGSDSEVTSRRVCQRGI
jgi:hypothetical protein